MKKGFKYFIYLFVVFACAFVFNACDVQTANYESRITEQDNIEELAFYPLSDGTYGVALVRAQKII